MIFILDFRVQITSVVTVSVFAIYIIAGTRPKGLLDSSDPLGLVGWMVVLVGLLFRSWAAGVLHKEHKLATIGPYSLTRHPLYMGTLLSSFGFAILLSQPGFYAIIMAMFLLVYMPKLRQEEKKMAAKFGDEWEAFKKMTFMFFPRRFPPRMACPWQLSQWLHNKEYRAVAPGAILLALLEILHRNPL